MDKRISITWEEWKAGREAKRESLRRLGLDSPSRRSASSSDRRLRKAFGGKRFPDLSGVEPEPPSQRDSTWCPGRESNPHGVVSKRFC